MTEETLIPDEEMVGGVAGELHGETVNFGPGFAGAVSAEQNMTFTKSGAIVAAAGNDLDMTGGGAMMIAVGRDLDMDNGGAMVTVVGGNMDQMNGGSIFAMAGGNMEITNGGAIAVVGSQVNLQQGSVGILLSPGATLGEDTKVIINTPQAIAIGAAFGVVAAILGWLLRRR